MTAAPAAPEMTSRALIRRVARTYMASRTAGYLASLGCAAVAVAAAWGLAQPLTPAVNHGIVGRQFQSMLWMGAAIVGLGLTKALFSVLHVCMVHAFGHRPC